MASKKPAEGEEVHENVPEANLAHRAARGASITVVAQGGRILVQTLGLVTLARLVSPAEFGLMALTVVFVGLGEVVRDFGLSNAAIQARRITTNQRDTLFWINLSIGLTLAVAMFFTAPLIAAGFGEPGLERVAKWISLVLVLNGAATQYRASLTRSMRFVPLAASDLFPQIFGLGVAIAIAALGYGVEALIAQQLVAVVLMLTIVMVASRWLPGIPRRPVGIAPFLRYGWNLFLAEILIFASKNIDTIVLGARYGATTVGFYSRAYQLLMVPIMQINLPLKSVALPTLARLQDSPGRYANFLLRAQKTLMYGLALIIALAAGLAYPAIEILLGSDWVAVAPLFQALAVGGVFHVLYYATMWVFLSRGLTREYFKYTLIVRTLMISLVIGGAAFGPLGVAIGYSIALTLQWPIALLWTRHTPGVPAAQMFKNGIRVLSLAVLVAGTSYSVWYLLADANIFVGLLTGAFAAFAAFGTVALIWPATRRDLHEVMATVRLVVKR